MKNYKLQITNYKFILVFSVLLSLLSAIPLLCQGFFLDEFFEEFDDFLPEQGGGTQSPLDSEHQTGQVINEINVSANTGGNKAESGEIIEGESKSEVHIKNVINGKEIDPIDIESDSGEVKVENKIEVTDDKAEVSREIEIGSEKTEKNYEVDLILEEEGEGNFQNAASENEENESMPGDGEEYLENLNFIEKLYLDFVENLKSLFNNIFNKLI